jgi:uncharacterized protein (TIGR02246 family)
MHRSSTGRLALALLVMTPLLVHAGEPSMSDADIQSFAARYTKAWCSRDPRQVASFFSPSGSLKVNDGAPAVGTAAITEVARGFMTAFPDLVIQLDRVERRGDRVLYHWTLTGTNTGPGGTGRRVRVSGYEDWKFGADGLVAESLGHFDAAEYDRQLKGL